MSAGLAIIALPAAAGLLIALAPMRRLIAVLLANATVLACFVLAWLLPRGDFVLSSWAAAGAVHIPLGLLVDPLSSTFTLVITGVGFLILAYSAGYMAHEVDYRRYWSGMLLFIAAMLLLVLADGFAVLLIGWAGVGFASYLLIGFWYHRAAAVAAARKAFLVNVGGDVAILLAIFVLQAAFGRLDYAGVLAQAGQNTLAAGVAALLLLLGAAAKSAQLPLHTWLPDAMEGPTPVSALIHAATMVTAGVYLIARVQPLFAAAPPAADVAAVVGGATALWGGVLALTQLDIKRVLAYSTMSQVGYMVMGAAVGAVGAAVSHVAVHACFKALLFMGAGAVMHALGGEERDLRRMGGLARVLPAHAWLFGIGAATLAGGFGAFWSKDAVIDALLPGHPWLYALALLVAGITSLYAFRLLFLTFSGNYRGKTEPERHLAASFTWPAVVLAAGSVLGGFLAVFVWRQMGEPPSSATTSALALALALAGFLLAWRLYYRGGLEGDRWLAWLPGTDAFDALYATAVVRPGAALAAAVRAADDSSVRALGGWVAQAAARLGNGLRPWQSGYVRQYALGLLVGALCALAWAVLRGVA